MIDTDVFVTGTHDRVGKTHLAVAIARRQISKGRTPGFLKPAQGGRGDDARLVAQAAAGAVCTTVYRYAAALAPAVAARLQHTDPPSIEHLVDAVDELRAATDTVIVEGCGGLLTPLSDTQSCADLAAVLGLALVIVTIPEPAAINYVALTLDAARRRGIDVAGVVVNRCTARPDLAERTTRSEFGRMATVLASLPIAETAAV